MALAGRLARVADARRAGACALAARPPRARPCGRRPRTSPRARRAPPPTSALAQLDLGEIQLAAGAAGEAASHLRAALEAGGAGIPRALARLRLAEALAQAGEAAAAEAELEAVPFEPAGAADMPEAMVPRIARAQALIAAARGDLGLAGRRLDEAERGWRRLSSAGPSGDAFAAALVDLGRPPVAGLVVPDQELALLAADRAALARAGEGVA